MCLISVGPTQKATCTTCNCTAVPALEPPENEKFQTLQPVTSLSTSFWRRPIIVNEQRLRTWTDSACDGIGDSIAREGSTFRRISPLITLLHFHAEWPELIWWDRWGKACFRSHF